MTHCQDDHPSQPDLTRRYYQTQARPYFEATHAVALPRLWARLSQHLAAPATLLDLGCGSGRDLHYLARQGYRIIGLDYAAALLQLAQEFAGQPLVWADMTALPFAPHCFDAVWAVGSLLHLPPPAVPAVLTALRRIMKPGAVLLTSMKKGEGHHIEPEGRYFAYYQPEQWTSLLTRTGYDIVEMVEEIETRQTAPGHSQRIPWLVSLARR